MKSFVYPLTQCKDSTLYPIPRASVKSHKAYVKVGCRVCSVCESERQEQKSTKWCNRLRAMIQHYQSNGDRVVFATLTVHDKDYPDYAQMKTWLKALFHRMRNHSKNFQFKYWAVIEYGAETGRIHAHVFFFLPKAQSWKELEEYIRASWQGTTGAYIFHSRLVDTKRMAANYATKYASKGGLAYKNDRIMGSRFGWVAFMEEVRRKWLGSKNAEGFQDWVAYQKLDIEKLVAAARVQPDQVIAENAINNFTPVMWMRTDKPVLHPFGACPLTLLSNDREDSSCKMNQDATGLFHIPAQLTWLPATFDLLPLHQLEWAKLSRALKETHGLSLNVHIQS